MEKHIIIGKRIEEAMKYRGKTQVDVAKAIGKNKSTVGRYIKGEVKDINITILKAIAEYLFVNPVWLAGKDAPMEIEEIKHTSDDFTYALYKEKTITEEQKDAIYKMYKLFQDSNK